MNLDDAKAICDAFNAQVKRVAPRWGLHLKSEALVFKNAVTQSAKLKRPQIFLIEDIRPHKRWTEAKPAYVISLHKQSSSGDLAAGHYEFTLRDTMVGNKQVHRWENMSATEVKRYQLALFQGLNIEAIAQAAAEMEPYLQWGEGVEYEKRPKSTTLDGYTNGGAW